MSLAGNGKLQLYNVYLKVAAGQVIRYGMYYASRGIPTITTISTFGLNSFGFDCGAAVDRCQDDLYLLKTVAFFT